MTTQTEMFPKTELDQAHQILSHLINEEEKAETASENADKKLSEAQSRVYKQRQVISWLQAKMPAAKIDVEFADAEDAELVDEDHRIEGDVLDPITGEVVGKAALAEGLEPVAEEMLADLAEEGVIATDAAETCAPEAAAARGAAVVVAVYPGDDPHATQVGDHTQYAELVADYLAAAGLDAELKDFEVVAKDEVETNGGGGRNLHAPIQPQDYGKRLLIQRIGVAEQVSAA